MPKKTEETRDYSSSEEWSNEKPKSKKRSSKNLEKASPNKRKKIEKETDQTPGGSEQKKPSKNKKNLSERAMGWDNAMQKIRRLKLYAEPIRKRSTEYMEGYRGAYEYVYMTLNDTRDDNNIEQLAFVLGQHDMATKGGIARKRPSDKKAPLYIHWDTYVLGTQSYQDPLAQLDLEKEGVGVLFRTLPLSQLHEEARNLAVNDYIAGNDKKTPGKLAEINPLPEFIQFYETTYARFDKGYLQECLSMRRGTISNLYSANEKDAAYFAGVRYAVYKFMRENQLTERPTSEFMAAYFGKKDATAFKLPMRSRMTAEFERMYRQHHAAALDEMENSEFPTQKKLVQLFKLYIETCETLPPKDVKRSITLAEDRGRKTFNGGFKFSPDDEKLKRKDPAEIAYQYAYYRKLFLKGEASDENKMEAKGKAAGSMSARRGNQPKSIEQIKEMFESKGSFYTEAFIQAYRETSSGMNKEQITYRYFYTKGKNAIYALVKNLALSFKKIDFDKNDPLYLLKKEAYLLGLLKGLETKNEKFDEEEKLKLRLQFTQELNAISSARIGEVSVLSGESGLFARRIIYPGEIFLEYMGEVKSKEEAEPSRDAAQLDYNRVKDAAGKKNPAKYTKHSDNPNAQLVVIGDDLVMFEALEAIETGNQILINYGPNYPIKNKIGINPWDNEATSDLVYEKNIEYYSPQPFHFEEDFGNELGLPAKGPYLIIELMNAMLEGEDEAFDKALKKEVLELPMLAIEDDNLLLVFSDLNLNYYCNALMLACFIGSITYVTKLLEAGARGNVLQRNNNSLLHIVFCGRGTEEEKIEIALLLLKNGVNPFIINNDKVWFFSLMDKAITSKQLKLTVLEKLDPNTALLYACYANASEWVEWLVKKNHCFDLRHFVEGRLYSEFREEIVTFLKALSENDKKLFEALFSYATLYSYEEHSSASSPAFFKPIAIENSQNKLFQNFSELSKEQFSKLYQFIHEKKIFNSYSEIICDLESVNDQFSILTMLPTTPIEETSQNNLDGLMSSPNSTDEEDLEFEALDEWDESESMLFGL